VIYGVNNGESCKKKVSTEKEGKKIKKETFYLVMKLCEPMSDFLIAIRSK
jgi:hypothetical protein